MAAVAFQDRLGFLGGSDPQPSVAQGGDEVTEDSEENIVGGFNPEPIEDTGIEQTSVEQTTSETTEELVSDEEPEGTFEQQFVTEYYEAVAREDWDTTYSLLSNESKMKFTLDEWYEAQEARVAATNPPPLESATLQNIAENSVGFQANVLLKYSDGSEETVPIEVVQGDGGLQRNLSDEDISYLEDLIGGETSTLAEETAIEDTIRNHYEAIGRGDFYEAYSYFGPDFRSANSEDDWVAEEESYDITSSAVNSVEVDEVSENSANATVDVSFEDNTGSPRFLITWSLVKEDGEWKLDDVSTAEEI